MTNKIESESITLRTETGSWIGQIVITSDGAFMSITDYGNFSFAWRSFGEKTLGGFKEFLLNINQDYFARKMYQGIAYIAYGSKFEKAAEKFAHHVFPALKQHLENESK